VEIESRHFRHLVVLADTGSFSSAARRLGLSQPALTRSIQALERELRTRLCARHGRGIELTPAGAMVAARAQALLQGLSDLDRELEDLKGAGAGRLRVGGGPGACASLIPMAVGRICGRRPRVRIEVVRGQWTELGRAVADREIDLFVGDCGDAEEQPELEVVRLRTRSGFWVCRAGHPLARGGRLTLDDLAGYPLAVPTLPERMGPELRTLARAAWVRSDDFYLLKLVILASDAVGLQPLHSVRDELETGRMKRLNVAGTEAVSRPGVVRLRSRRLGSVGAALIEEIRMADLALASESEALPE
jgi:DNA-binding transcriptional LysR family regulator